MLLFCSIRNKNGQSAADVAVACGHTECGRYLQSAALHQESQPKGVFGDTSANPSQPMEPSMHDITVKSRCNGGHIDPCIITQGLNGGKIPPVPSPQSMLQTIPEGFPRGNHDHGDCEMEAEESLMPLENNASAALLGGGDSILNSAALTNQHVLPNGDVTLDHGVSSNMVPVAGRKRTRESEDDMIFKRQKTVTESGK